MFKIQQIHILHNTNYFHSQNGSQITQPLPSTPLKGRRGSTGRQTGDGDTHGLGAHERLDDSLEEEGEVSDGGAGAALRSATQGAMGGVFFVLYINIFPHIVCE